MAKIKGSSKKQQKKGVDFKKIKRKIGRKLPPPKNATNTEIKSKAIILPEQSVASEKTGLAVSKKGLTLKELLQQTSHHNAKVRKDALLGMKDLFHKYPEELKLHRYAVIEKLRERISDEDKFVRETLYQLLKSVILPGCKEDNQGPLISLMMVYIFNAMTHLAVDVELMAFKFFDLVVQYHPPSFSLYAEKILQNYEDFLRKNQFYLEEKGKLKIVLAGLMQCLLLLSSKENKVDLSGKNAPGEKILHAFEPDVPTESADLSSVIKKLKNLVPVLVNCFQDFMSLIHSMPVSTQSFDCMLSILQSVDLAVQFLIHEIHKVNAESLSLSGGDEVTLWNQMTSSLLLKKLLAVFPLNLVHHLSEKDDDRYFALNIAITEIFLHLGEWICPPADLMEKFLGFIEYSLLGKLCSGTPSKKVIQEKQMLTLINSIPKLLSQVTGDWKFRLLQAFTKAFQVCNPGSGVKLACLAAIEEMLISRDVVSPNGSDSELLDHQITWMRELPLLLILLGDGHPSSSQVVLHLLLRLGQCSLTNSCLALEYDNLQFSLQEFYSTFYEDGNVCLGPFLKLPKDSQELSVCCLYYFSHLDSPLLKSIAFCCLFHELDALVLFRIIEVLDSAYKAGHVQIADHISFFITLVSRFKVFPENIYPAMESNSKISNRGTFKSMTSVLCSYLSQMGDNSLVFLILERVILERLSSKPPLDNACAMLRMLVVLDSKPTRLSEHSVILLSNFLSVYLIDVACCVPEDDGESMGSSDHMRPWHYYMLPCFFLFDRSQKLLKLVLNVMGSLISESSASLSSGDHTQYSMDYSGRIDAIVSILLLMHQDVKIRQLVSSLKTEIDNISQSICSLQSSGAINLTKKERHRIQHSFVRLKTITSSTSGEP